MAARSSSLEFGVPLRRPHARKPVRGRAGPEPATGPIRPTTRPAQPLPGRFRQRPRRHLPEQHLVLHAGPAGRVRCAVRQPRPGQRASTSTTSTRSTRKTAPPTCRPNFDRHRWSGNVGVRYVKTKENIGYTSTTPMRTATTSTGPITGSAFGNYYWNTYKHCYGKFLPSANLKFDVTDDLLAALRRVADDDPSGLLGAGGLRVARRPDPYRQRRQPAAQAADLEQLRCLAGVVLRAARPAVRRRVRDEPEGLRQLQQRVHRPTRTCRPARRRRHGCVQHLQGQRAVAMSTARSRASS